MYEMLRKKLDSLPKKSLLLVIVPAEFYHAVSMLILRHWMDISQDAGTYVSLNRPFNNLMDSLATAKIDERKLFFVDCVTKNELDIPNCYFLKSQQNLKNLQLAISSLVKTRKPRFLILDSLNTVSLYNPREKTKEFTNFLVNKARASQMDMILLATENNENKEQLQELSALCDRVIDLSEE